MTAIDRQSFEILQTMHEAVGIKPPDPAAFTITTPQTPAPEVTPPSGTSPAEPLAPALVAAWDDLQRALRSHTRAALTSGTAQENAASAGYSNYLIGR